MRLNRARPVHAIAVAIGCAIGIGVAFSCEASGPDDSATPRYDVIAQRDVMIPMRDGVRLATDIYLPAINGKPADSRFPALLTRTPYSKSTVFPSEIGADYATAHGYVFIVQDVRGRYQSEGHWRPFKDDGTDGYDLLKWIGEQSWSDGKVGTFGTSYAGGTQHALALAGAPNLTAMIPVDAASNIGRYGMRHAGAFELRWFNWVFTLGNATGPAPATMPAVVQEQIRESGKRAATRAAVDPSAAPQLVALGDHVREYVTQLPLKPGATPLKLAPDYQTWLIEALGHGDNDAFWTDSGIDVVDHVAQYKDVPVYHVTGAYDSWGASVADLNYVALSKSKQSRQRLIIGPWTHGSQRLSYAGIAEFGPAAALDMNEFKLRWFDHWLKGADNGVDREPPVRIFVMGGGDAHKTPEGRLFVGGAWRDEHEWPLARAIPTRYYLGGDHSLLTDLPTASPPSAYRFDPQHPVPSIGGNISSAGQLMINGAQDQKCRREYWHCEDAKPLSERSDVVVFQTSPLDRNVEVTGTVVVKLWASSDGKDTDFTAKLVDVYPPNDDFPAGVELNVGDGIVRARYRNSLTHAEPLEPGKPTEFTIALYPTSLVFQRGHRIRIDISSSNFPRFDANPNTYEPLNANTRWRIAANTIYHDAEHPSHVVLPMIPGEP